MSRIVVFSLMVVSGMAFAGQSYYADPVATDSWLQRHYDGYPVSNPAAQSAQDSQDKDRESWAAKYYSGKPADEEVILPAQPADSVKPIVHTTQVDAKPANPVDRLSPQTITPEHTTSPEHTKSLVIHSEETHPENQHNSDVEENPVNDSAHHAARKGSLPGGMDRGIDNVEEGLSELKGYTKDVTSNIKEKGLRGFLDVPPEQQAKGRAIGEKIGRGIRDVMDEVGKDMVGNR